MIRFITKSLALVALVGAMTASQAQAALLTGEVNYTGDATMNGFFVNFGDTNIESATGSFAGFMSDGDPVIHVDPMLYNPFPVLGFTPLWSHASGVTFDLSTLIIEFESPLFLVLSGSGVFHAPGFDDTSGVWGLTVNQFGVGSFSASSTVPTRDTGNVPEPASLSLLGLGLAGVAVLRRRLKA